MSATQKLIHFGIDRETAERLTSHGYMTPRAIREATKVQLKKATGFSDAKVTEIKNNFDRSEKPKQAPVFEEVKEAEKIEKAEEPVE